MKVYLLFILTTLVPYVLVAQNISNSPYSIYGIGNLNHPNSSITKSLGGAGIGLRHPLYINNTNPASYNAINDPLSMMFELGLFYQTAKFSTENISEDFNDGGITNFNLLFRFNDKWAGNIGLIPISNVEFSLSSEQTLNDVGLESLVLHQQTGGINKLFFGNSYLIAKNLSLGMNASLIFGNIERSDNVTLSNTVLPFEVEQRTTVSQFDLDFGLQYQILIGQSNLTLGGTFDYRTELNASTTKSLFTSDADTLISEDVAGTKYALPTTYGVGLAYTIKRHTLLVDLYSQLWQEIDLEDTEGLQNTQRYAFGYQFDGAYNKERPLSTVSFRAGAFYQNYYLQIDGKNIDNWGYTLGLGLPFANQRFQLNLTYEYSNRGTTDFGLIEENYNNFHFDIIFRDIWNKQRRYH